MEINSQTRLESCVNWSLTSGNYQTYAARKVIAVVTSSGRLTGKNLTFWKMSLAYGMVACQNYI